MAVFRYYSSFLDTVPVLETLGIIAVDIISCGLLDLFGYYSLDTVPGSQPDERRGSVE